MSPIKNWKYEFSEQEARVLLEAFTCLEKYMNEIYDRSSDDDERADIGMDLAYARLMHERIEQGASLHFGPQVLIQLYPKDRET